MIKKRLRKENQNRLLLLLLIDCLFWSKIRNKMLLWIVTFTSTTSCLFFNRISIVIIRSVEIQAVNVWICWQRKWRRINDVWFLYQKYGGDFFPQLPSSTPSYITLSCIGLVKNLFLRFPVQIEPANAATSTHPLYIFHIAI